ncbi:MAG: hypothetical protein IT524_05110 [Nitrosomonas sp.]|nr:hypothetical protein [Nitrosomonas sp.]
MINLLQLTTLIFTCLFSILLIVSPATAVSAEASAAATCCSSSELIELPKDAVEKLDITAGFGWGIFSGTVYNGNQNYQVTQLVVSMTPIHGHHHGDMHATMSHEPKVHQINLEIPPLSKGALSMPLANEDSHIHDFDWTIIKVMGHAVR